VRSQLDIFSHSPAALAAAARVAAATAAVDPYWSPREQRERQAYYLAEAERLEACAALDKELANEK